MRHDGYFNSVIECSSCAIVFQLHGVAKYTKTGHIRMHQVKACPKCGQSLGLNILKYQGAKMIIDRMKVLGLWQNAHIKPERLNEMKHVAGLVMQYKAHFYDPVEAATRVPWYVTGAIDSREENFSHGGYLGNGDPLSRVTTHVPRGRGPFTSWYAGAIDAYHLDGMDHLPVGGHWDIVTALIKCEAYNGLGYASKGLPSPYVWGGTNIQKPGKYIRDGVWSSTAWDSQPGCAAIWLALKQFHNVDLSEA